MRLNPDATYDCLFVAHRLQTQIGTFTAPEIHLFSYLACLLWLYRERPVTDWGYPFVGTEFGAPFSQEIDAAVKELLKRGYFLRVQERLRMTELAEQTLGDFGQLTLNRERTECLQAACASTAAFSVGMVRSAMTQEPELKRAQAVPASRRLLDERAKSQLYLQFCALRQAISQKSNDLRLPAVVWLAALYRSSEPTAIES